MAKRGLVALFAALLALAWQSHVANAVSWLPAVGCTTNCRDDHTCLKTDTGCSDAWNVCPEGFEAVGDWPRLPDGQVIGNSCSTSTTVEVWVRRVGCTRPKHADRCNPWSCLRVFRTGLSPEPQNLRIRRRMSAELWAECSTPPPPPPLPVGCAHRRYALDSASKLL